MATEIKMPQLSFTMETGVIGKWRKEVGDPVHVGDILFEVETDKLTSEVESEVDGVLKAIYANEGEELPIRAVLGLIGSETEAISLAPRKKTEATLERFVPKKGKASPYAKKVAKEWGIDLEEVRGSGVSGRIMYRDLLFYAENQKTDMPKETTNCGNLAPVSKAQMVPLEGMRKAIARHMTQSHQEVPQVTLMKEVNGTRLVELRARFNRRDPNCNYRYTDLFLKIVATALQRAPQLNATLQGDGIVQHAHVHLGIAVAVEGGLLVPVVRNVDQKGLKQLHEEVDCYIAQARNGQLSRDVLQGGTFTISNLGSYEIDGFTPIVNLPESAILGVGRMVRKPVFNEADEIVPAWRITLSLSFDHRVADGAEAARLLHLIGAYVEEPGEMLL